MCVTALERGERDTHVLLLFLLLAPGPPLEEREEKSTIITRGGVIESL